MKNFLKRGHSVTCLVRKTSNLQWIDGLKVRLIYGDCAIKESLLNAVADFDYIFHLAGLTKAANEKDFFSANALGTENLVSAVIEKNPDTKRFVYLSSLAAAEGRAAMARRLKKQANQNLSQLMAGANLKVNG